PIVTVTRTPPVPPAPPHLFVDERPKTPGVLDELPITVVDTIIRNNKAVKKCFFAEQQASGTLPSVVEHFHIRNEGLVDQAAISDPDQWRGTELDRCLTLALRTMQ